MVVIIYRFVIIYRIVIIITIVSILIISLYNNCHHCHHSDRFIFHFPPLPQQVKLVLCSDCVYLI